MPRLALAIRFRRGALSAIVAMSFVITASEALSAAALIIMGAFFLMYRNLPSSPVPNYWRGRK
jgi:hypothetical protein